MAPPHHHQGQFLKKNLICGLSSQLSSGPPGKLPVLPSPPLPAGDLKPNILKTIAVNGPACLQCFQVYWLLETLYNTCHTCSSRAVAIHTNTDTHGCAFRSTLGFSILDTSTRWLKGSRVEWTTALLPEHLYKVYCKVLHLFQPSIHSSVISSTFRYFFQYFFITFS